MKKEQTEMPEDESKVILYTTDDGKAQVSLMSRDGRVWLNQKQMAELFAVTKMNISLHIANILKEKELDDSVVKFFFTTAADDRLKNPDGRPTTVTNYGLRKREEARLADEADLEELKLIEDEAKKRHEN